MTAASTYVSLDRGSVTVSGADAFKFLQNIVSNDLALLATQPQIQACLLTPQGKYLHDFYITRRNDDYVLDCEAGERATDLSRRLSLYKLRAQVVITATEHTTIYCDITSGLRIAVKPEGTEVPFSAWDEQRIKSGKPDGSRDAEIGISTLAELNLDIDAVSYTKGCYIGQELVARMHNRNLGKKSLVPVQFYESPPDFGVNIIIAGETIGEMRSNCGKIGLILMRNSFIGQSLSENALFEFI